MTTKRQVQPALPPRERIIAAAADLFHKQGIRGVGVEAIAEAAGTNKMTLYRHFASKDELIAEWARGKVLRVALTRTASGYRASRTETWVKGIKQPVAVTIGRDGAVYIGDWSTGTVYRIAQISEG